MVVYRRDQTDVNVLVFAVIFKPMNKKDVLKALEGHKNILAPAVEQNERFFKSLSCPMCRGDVMPLINTRQLFKPGELLPNYLGKCKTCGCEFEPYTGVIVARPEGT